jgi:hypothetical protein
MTCLPIFIVPNWKLEFHVHINALNFALGAMLNQNPDKTIDKPIYYVSRMMNNVEKNYTTSEKEALAMIYVVKKFRHYLLGNNFIFLWSTKLYYIWSTNPIMTGQIARWLLLLQELDFKIIFKLGRVHFLLDQLSRINHGEPTIGVEDQLLNA